MITVAELLAVRKRVSGRPKLMSDAGPNTRWDIPISADIGGQFVAFVRINTVLPEDFSIGLRYNDTGLHAQVRVRVNCHGQGHRNPDGSMVPEGPHIHLPGPGQMVMGIDRVVLGAGSKHASPLPGSHRRFLVALDTFGQKAGLEVTEEVRAFFRKNKVASGQMRFL